MSQTANFKITQATDFSVVFLCLQGMKNADFTGCSALLQLRQSTYGRVIDELSTINGRLSFPAIGRLQADFPHEVTELYPIATLVYDVRITDAEGQQYILVAGKITVKGSVSR